MKQHLSAHHLAYFLIVSILVMLGCSPSGDSASRDGTPYTRLDLGTPESAVSEFHEVFEMDRFPASLRLRWDRRVHRGGLELRWR